VTTDEIAGLAAAIGLDAETFGRRFVRQVGDRLSLVEAPSHACVFWDPSAGCTVYEARPAQCRTWPFWPRHLVAPEAWRRAADSCPGIGSGSLHTIDQVEAQARRAAAALRDP
jgi:Fe-S-cluster containining protein